MSYLKRNFLFFVILLPLLLFPQGPKAPASVKLYNDLQDLNFLGSALYIAAHPDDENTRLISYLSNAVHARTAYLSLTRGDGGQNLIGPELRELLGVLRTQELLAARRVDGGEQFFTRAVDFGYSKHPDETLSIWDKQEVLSDVVRIIRTFKPDVIVNRFDHRTPGSTHGHHTSSAILSTEAFDLAGDPTAFSSQIEDVGTWQPKRLYHNTSWWFYGSEERFLQAMQEKDLVQLDVGVYYPEVGLSNNEIASLASSQHLCQGFGRPMRRGSETEYLERIKGTPANGSDLFAGIDTSWERLQGGAPIGAILEGVEADFNFADPSVHLPALVEAWRLLSNLEDSHWKRIKSEQLKNLIAGVSGLYMEASAENPTAVPGSRAAVNLELVNRSGSDVVLKRVSLEAGTRVDTLLPLGDNQRHMLELRIDVPKDQASTGPYWLRQPGSLGSYSIPDPSLIGKPETPPAFHATLQVAIEGVDIPFSLPVVHRYAEPDQGERYRSFDIIPPVTASFSETVKIFADDHGRPVSVLVRSQAEDVSGRLRLEVPEGWIVTPEAQDFSLQGQGDEQEFQFELLPPAAASEGIVQPVLEAGGQNYSKELITIAYDHIPTQLVLMPAKLKTVRLDVRKTGQHIGYIMGAGDAVPESLEAIGYTVHLIDPSEISEESLKPMDAVVLGIRAYNVLDELPFKNNLLLDYVENGGTVVVQYNTSGRGPRDFSPYAPYPLQLSRDRVSDENAPVRILDNDHPVLNYPNPIEPTDFNGWVQERGLYFPDAWDPAFEPVLSMNDPGEPERKGSLLIAPYGKGHYIYTGLSFFRELPAGVPGAFKLFANMLSIGEAKQKNEREVKG